MPVMNEEVFLIFKLTDPPFHMNKLLRLIIGFTLIIPLTFTFIFLCNKSSFSVANPERSPYLQDTLGELFPVICKKPSLSSDKLHASSRGCYYNYDPNLGYGAVRRDRPDQSILQLQVGFHSYKDGNLNLRYHILYNINQIPNRVPDEYGIITFDLSLTTKSHQEMMYKLNPYIASNNYLLKRVESVPTLVGVGSNKVVAYPSILSILAIEVFNIEATGSSTSRGEEFPYFTVRDNNNVFLRFKNYFEEGEIQSYQFGRFLAFSISNFTGFGISDFYPNTSWMKVLCALETLIGMILFGIYSAFVFEWILEKKKLVTKMDS